MKPEHKPFGDPCPLCHFPAVEHTVFHCPEGNPCIKCGLPEANHKPAPETISKHKKYNQGEKGKARTRRYKKTDKGIATSKKFRYQTHESAPMYLGIDGEGQGDKDHAYVYLAISSIDGSFVRTLESPTWREKWNGKGYESGVKSIPTATVLDFLLSLPQGAKLFAFSFNYDLTKILTDVDDAKLYRLFRPEMRAREGKRAAMLGPKPVSWGEYWLNYQSSKFTLKKGNRRVVIWDIFKFFATKFVTAIRTWKVGNPELWERMTEMKDKRGAFDKQDPESVAQYCLEECRCMAKLAQKLTEAHLKVDLPLKQYFGAGSSAGAMLKAMGIKEKLHKPPEMMEDAVARAFFGGRFENSVIGAIRRPLWNYDISSAYPYQTYFLPCLEHGAWKRTEKRSELDSCSNALVRYGFDESRIPSNHKLHPNQLRGQPPAWGPFPYRTKNGSICFPWTSPGGWVYREEYLRGEAVFPHVVMKEAFVYRTECDCRPFERIAHYYLYRNFVGKDEGPGLTIKLAVNSVYGKLAQSVGSAQFNSWIWAGMITSGCRAQILEMMGLVVDLRTILMIATDGILCDYQLSTPKPKNTGTDYFLEEVNGVLQPSLTLRNKKPLGGWEEKCARKGMFLARPGIYFPLYPDEDEMGEIKGRGVGRGVILNHHEDILNAWRYHGGKPVTVANVKRFCGAKTSIHRSRDLPFRYTRASGQNGPTSPSYGQWIHRKVELGFDPMPKREGVNPDGVTLKIRRIEGDELSARYSKTVISKEARELRAATTEMLEQPDFDFSEFTEEGDL